MFVLINMSAAFDLLDKSILVPKLRAHGFPERVIAIYNDFLNDRKAVVQVGESFFNLIWDCPALAFNFFYKSTTRPLLNHISY